MKNTHIMKAVYITLLTLSLGFVKAQSDLRSELLSFLAGEKEITLNRLVALNVWSANDVNSRSLNKEFDKAYSIYHGAKLKGGSQGIVCVMICLDKNDVAASIAVKKDGVVKLIQANSENKALYNLIKDKKAGYNIVFDKDGNTVYENLKPGTVATSVNQLITR